MDKLSDSFKKVFNSEEEEQPEEEQSFISEVALVILYSTVSCARPTAVAPHHIPVLLNVAPRGGFEKPYNCRYC